MATKETIGLELNVAQTRTAPDWDSGLYLNFAGRTVKHSDIVNMTNMDVARNSPMLSFAKIAGPLMRVVPHPAVKAIGMLATIGGYGYDSYKLMSRMAENKSNDAFWSEYNEAVKIVQAQDDTRRIATDFAIGSNLASGQSLPANVKPIGDIAGGLGQMAQYVALGVLGGTKTFIFGGAISNALNEANTRMGYGEEQGGAIKAGIARGIASGVTAAAFLHYWPRAVERMGGYMIDKGTGLGFVSHPATNAALRGAEFAGWGAVDPYAVNTARYVAGLEPENHEFDPTMTAGMFALGAVMSGGLLKKSYSFSRPRRLPSTGEKEYMNFAEMAAGKKSALKAVNETIGTRYFGDVTTPERQAELMNIQAGKELKPKEIRGTLIEGPLTPVQERLAQPFVDQDKFNKTVNEIILSSYGVPKRLTTTAALEKVGGPEAALRLTMNEEQTIERAMSEISTANRLIKQSQEYSISSRDFVITRYGNVVEDMFIAGSDGIAKKVRIADGLYNRLFVSTPSARVAELPITNSVSLEAKVPEGLFNKGSITLSDYDSFGKKYRWNQGAINKIKSLPTQEQERVKTAIESMIDVGEHTRTKIDVKAVQDAMRKIGLLAEIPQHIKDAASKAGMAAIVSGMIYFNNGDDGWEIMETQWLTPAVASRIAEMARNDYRVTRDRQASITRAMNSLPDDYALNPDNYKMVYDRFMKLSGGYA